jgi:hypothetical protein
MAHHRISGGKRISMKHPRIKLTITLNLNSDESELLRIYRRYHELHNDGSAAKWLFRDGLRGFHGMNVGNPFMPELKNINSDKL